MYEIKKHFLYDRKGSWLGWDIYKDGVLIEKYQYMKYRTAQKTVSALKKGNHA